MQTKQRNTGSRWFTFLLVAALMAGGGYWVRLFGGEWGEVAQALFVFAALLAACGSRRLLTAHSDLYDQAYRYRRVMMRSLGSGEDFVAAHQNLADRVLARVIDGAQTMLRSHLASTLNYVYPPAKGG